MFKSAKIYWRIFGMGVGFALVGIGGIFVFPLLNLFIRDHRARNELARRVIRISFRGIVGLMRWLGVFHYEIMGLERLNRRGLLILANHPTLLDIVFLGAFVEQADCIVKNALWRNPFTHATVRAAGYIRNDDEETLLQRCIASVRDGSNLIIFPEGTRTPPDGWIKLKRGAANIAVRGVRNITPVLIRCTPRMLGKGEKWWQVPRRSAHFQIEVHEDIEIRRFITEAGSAPLAARHLTRYLQNLFVHGNHQHAFV